MREQPGTRGQGGGCCLILLLLLLLLDLLQE